MPLSSPPLVITAAGVIGSAWLSGAISSFSIAGAPAAIVAPQSTPQVWAELYRRGAASMPKFAVGITLSYLYAAYEAHSRGGSWVTLLGAAGSVAAIVPYTLVVMRGTNGRLHKAARKEDEVLAAEVETLVERWIVLNFGRAMFPLLGAALGSWAFFKDAF